MIDWILHRPPHTCHPTEVRVAERLRMLADSPQPWTAIRGNDGPWSPPSPKARSATAASSERQSRRVKPVTPYHAPNTSQFPIL